MGKVHTDKFTPSQFVKTLFVGVSIKDGLRAKGYVFTLLGEESSELAPPPDVQQVIIDGIDGTCNFRYGNYGWCISVAVRLKGKTLVAVVYDPRSDETYFAIREKGAFIHSSGHTKKCHFPPVLPDDFSFSIGSFRVSDSATIKGKIIEDIKQLGGRGRDWGSVALSICAVARGGLGTFIQGNSYSYDHIAALLIAEEAGADIMLHPKIGTEIADVIVSHPLLSHKINAIFDFRINETPS